MILRLDSTHRDVSVSYQCHLQATKSGLISYRRGRLGYLYILDLGHSFLHLHSFFHRLGVEAPLNDPLTRIEQISI